MDVTTGQVVDDVESVGTVPYFDQLVRPGVLVAGVTGAPDGIYAVAPDSNELVRLARLDLHEDQEGYEKHANSQFASDLVLSK